MMNKCSDCGWHIGVEEPKRVLVHENNLIARCWPCWVIHDHKSTPYIQFILEGMIKNWQNLAKVNYLEKSNAHSN